MVLYGTNVLTCTGLSGHVLGPPTLLLPLRHASSRGIHSFMDRTFKNQVHRLSNLGRTIACTRNRQLQTSNKNGGSTNGQEQPTFRERLRELRHNGTPELVFGTLIILLVAVDYALQARNDEQRSEVYRHLERDVLIDGAESRKEMMSSYLTEGQDDAKQPRFNCTVRRVPENFDGHKCLTDIKVGDVVAVIDEGVGPGGQYNLCSIDRNPRVNRKGLGHKELTETKNTVSVGWFPCSCLQKIE